MLNLGLRIVVFCAGLLLIMATMRSAIITFVLPRSAPEKIVRTWFRLLRRLVDLRLHWAKTYGQRDRIMALYAPISLILLLPIWLLLVTIGFACLYWATGMASQIDDLILSGSSLLTLGFARGDTLLRDILAHIGLRMKSSGFSSGRFNHFTHPLRFSLLPLVSLRFQPRGLHKVMQQDDR